MSRTTRTTRTAVLVPIAATLLGVLAGCATPADTAPPSPSAVARATGGIANVGQVVGSDALIAVTTAGTDVVAYVCDGDAALGERFAGTLEPAPDGLRAVLRSAGGAQLDLVVAGDTARGTFTAVGTAPAAFVTEPATGDAGLYLADTTIDEEPVSAGWVLLADGTQSGTVVRDHRKEKAPPVERVVGTRPAAPTSAAPTSAKTKPRRTDAEIVEARKRVVRADDVATSKLCITDPSRCA